jgi:hypothetical protein
MIFRKGYSGWIIISTADTPAVGFDEANSRRVQNVLEALLPQA